MSDGFVRRGLGWGNCVGGVPATSSTVASFARQFIMQAAVFSGWDAKSTPTVTTFSDDCAGIRLCEGIHGFLAFGSLTTLS